MLANVLPEIYMGLTSLLVHKLRSLLTMLGMIFGVGSVVAMLAITAGAQKDAIAAIDLLGVNNILIEAKEAVDRNELQQRRQISPGLTFRDFRAIAENVPGLAALTPRKRFKPMKVLPKTSQEAPVLIGVGPSYLTIQSLKIVEGRWFTEAENRESVPVCVLAEKKLADRRQRVAVVASGGWLLSSLADLSGSLGGGRTALVNPGNRELLPASVAWLADRPDLLDGGLSGREVPRIESLDDGPRRAWMVGYGSAIVLGPIALGAIVLSRRRRRA